MRRNRDGKDRVEIYMQATFFAYFARKFQAELRDFEKMLYHVWRWRKAGGHRRESVE